MTDSARPRRPLLKPVLTAAVVGVVGWFVAGTVRGGWSELAASGVRLRWLLLVAAGVAYLIALAPMAWYWRRVVVAVDRPVAWGPLLAAYYAGHLGKYVPGKAMVVVLRTAMLRRYGGRTPTLAASVVVETLTMMATGAALAAVLLMLRSAADPPTGSGSPWLLAGAVGMAVVAATPTLPPVLRWLVTRLTKSATAPPNLSWRLLATGWAAAMVTWIGLAGSLWLTTFACGGETPGSLATARSMLLAATLPYVAGFLSLIPGGLVVRDALMLRLLAPVVGEGPALAIAAAARLVWIVAELCIYTGLVALRRGAARRRLLRDHNPAHPSEPAMTAATIVVPLLNEAPSLRELHGQVRAVAAEHGLTLRMVFVDDGSTDESWSIIQQLAAEDDRVQGIRFRRNFGKAAALSVGFDAAQDPFVITMDGDLQDDPQEVPRLLARLEGDAESGPVDVVSGWKKTRHDPLDKRLPSWAFNRLVSWLTGVRLHDHNCGLKAYRRDVLHEVRLYGELHRLIPVLAAARGFRIAELVVNHRPRKHGHSKYGASRLVKGFLDLLTVKFLTGYGDRPQHVLGTIGLGAFLLGAGAMVVLAGRWCLSRLVPGWEAVHLHETAALYYALAMLLVGSQFLSVGLLGEMITAFLARDVDTYSIAEHTGPVEGVSTEKTIEHRADASAEEAV